MTHYSELVEREADLTRIIKWHVGRVRVLFYGRYRWATVRDWEARFQDTNVRMFRLALRGEVAEEVRAIRVLREANR